MMQPLDEEQTALARRRYDRIAPIYDAVEGLMEFRARSWRRDLWSRVGPGSVLELGIGTGKNLCFYPRDREVVALDLSPRMLAIASARAKHLAARVQLQVGDVQCLPFANSSFSVIVATFLFCSVPDPQLGLAEVCRVLRPGGQLLLLEHVLSERPLLRVLLRRLDPVSFRLWGAHINRDTVKAVRDAGFADVVTTNLSFDIVRRIEARAPS
jgi:ubiquinone/menaquinone biosynthesis C-methylase UbiE